MLISRAHLFPKAKRRPFAPMESAAEGDGAALMAAINTTPLVDVMLVLLTIFLITIPIVKATQPLKLPQHAVPTQKEARVSEGAVVSIDAQGRIWWQTRLMKTPQELSAVIAAWQRVQPGTPLQIRADADSNFAAVDQLLALVQEMGVRSILFALAPDTSRATKVVAGTGTEAVVGSDEKNRSATNTRNGTQASQAHPQ